MSRFVITRPGRKPLHTLFFDVNVIDFRAEHGVCLSSGAPLSILEYRPVTIRS
jgi:hypothetical protein